MAEISSATREGQVTSRPFRFAVGVRHAQSRAEWVEKARKVEALGYATLTVPDHLADLLAPMPALISAAEATKSLRVGTNVLNNDLRHPVLVAREAAAVDLLTDGRLQLGLGAGSLKSEYDEAGLRFDRGAIRVERLGEAVAVIKRLLNGEQVAFAGRHYRVTGHKIAPLPAQKPHPPLLIGGNGRKLLELAAREADIVGFSGITFRQGGAAPPDLSGWRAPGVDERVRLVREAAGEARFARLELNALVQRVVVTENRRKAAEELAASWPQLSPGEILETPYVLIGTIDQMAEDLRARRERWGISNYAVHEPYMDVFAPVVARLAGT
jgi:probable F420-dependent oxidoreductase